MAAPDQNLESPRLPRLPGSANADGVEYEHKMAALVALRARAAGLEFQLYSNVRCAHPFDDLVLRVLEPRPALILVQLKHTKNPVSVKDLVSLRGGFSLSKYFKFFLKVQEYFENDVQEPKNKKIKMEGKKEVPLEEEEEALLKEVCEEHAQLVLYTPTSVCGPRGGPSEVAPLLADLLLTGEGGRGDVFRFQPLDSQVWNLKTGKNEGAIYHDFLSKLEVFNNQSDNKVFDDKIRAEIDEATERSLPSTVVKSIADKYVEIVKKWAEEDHAGSCLSEHLPQLGAAVAAVLRDLAVTAAFCESLRFEQAHCAKLRAALSGGDPLCVLLRGVPPGVRAAKLLQVLSEDDASWTYVDASIAGRYPRATLSAAVSSCKVLVLDADGDPEKLLPAGWGSSQLVQLCSGPRRIATSFRPVCPSVKHLEDDWTMGHLKHDAQEKLLDGQLVFQGRPVPLRHLEGAWPRLRAEVDGALLGALARGEAVLGAAPPAPDDDGPHVPRKWEHHALLDASVLEMNQPTEHLVLSGFDEEVAKELRQRCGVTENENDRWTLLPEGEGEAAFQKVACMHRNKNVHWVHLLGGRTLSDAVLQWRATERQEAALAAFALSPCERQPLCEHEGPPWGAGTLLLVGAAGAGKTCALRRAAAEARERAPARWAVYVELLTHRSFLRQLPPAHEILLDHAVDLLAAAAGVTAGASRRHLQAALSVKGGVAIFIDGVDEVSPIFKDRVLRLLIVLKRSTDSVIWVSCRPEVEETLLQELRCTATRLRALSREEQRRFLCERWAATHSTSPPEFSSFADKTIDALRLASGSLLDVPLHLSMAAEVFAAEAAQSPDTVFQQNVFILLVLYGRFVQMKRDIYLEKHDLKYAFGNLNIRDDFEEVHQNCAMVTLLSDSEEQIQNIHKFKIYVERNIDELRKEKSGMLWVDSDNNPHFAHFTFAEFFCARWLFEHKGDETAKELTECLLLKRHKSLALRFLDLMLVEEVHSRVQLPLHEALLADSKRDGEGVARALEEGARVDDVDGGGRTALHVAASGGNWRAMEALLKAGCYRHVCDSLLGWAPFQYAQGFAYAGNPDKEEYTSLGIILAKLEERIYTYLCNDICLYDCAKVALWLAGESSRCSYEEMLHRAAVWGAAEVVRALLWRGTRACGARDERPQGSGEAGVCPRGGDHTEGMKKALDETVYRRYIDLFHALRDKLNEDEEMGAELVALQLAAERYLFRTSTRMRLPEEGPDTWLRDSSEREHFHLVFSDKFIRQVGDEMCADYLQDFLRLLSPSTRSDYTNARDPLWRTPLHVAVDARKLKATGTLLAYGSDVNAADYLQRTPLHKVVGKGDVEMVTVLLDHGANPSLTDINRKQSLSYLYSRSYLTPQENYSEYDMEDIIDETSDHALIAALLLESGADPDCRDRSGRSLLHHATRMADLRTVKVLLQHHADVDLVDDRGQTARDLALDGGARWPKKKDTFDEILLLLNGRGDQRDAHRRRPRTLHPLLTRETHYREQGRISAFGGSVAMK